MANATIINSFGNVSGWNQIQFVLFGRTVEGIRKISYKDSREMESIMGAGPYPIGYNDGNYKAECSVELLFEEWQALMASLPAGTRIQDIPATDIPVLTMRNGKVTKDVIRNFRFPNQGKEVQQGDKSIYMDMGGFCSHIDWNQ